MKVMLPLQTECNSRVKIASGFHNISYVCIYDSRTKKREWLSRSEIDTENRSLNSALIKRGVFSIISLNISPMVLSMFRRSGIEVLKAKGKDLNENIRLFELSHLQVFSADETRLAQACSSESCTSFQTNCK